MALYLKTPHALTAGGTLLTSYSIIQIYFILAYCHFFEFHWTKQQIYKMFTG